MGIYSYNPYNPGALWGTFDINGNWYVLNNAIKPITINILRYSNETIDATFSGQFGYSMASMRTIVSSPKVARAGLEKNLSVFDP